MGCVGLGFLAAVHVYVTHSYVLADHIPVMEPELQEVFIDCGLPISLPVCYHST